MSVEMSSLMGISGCDWDMILNRLVAGTPVAPSDTTVIDLLATISFGMGLLTVSSSEHLLMTYDSPPLSSSSVSSSPLSPSTSVSWKLTLRDSSDALRWVDLALETDLREEFPEDFDCCFD